MNTTATETTLPTPPQRNLYLDVFKIGLAFLVVAMHFSLTELPPLIVRSGIPHLAVGCFFMIAGYYSFYDNDDKLQKCKSKIVRCLKLILLWAGIYLVYNLIKIIAVSGDVGAYLTHLVYEDFLTAFFFYHQEPGLGYGLWFLLALFTVYVGHYFCEKYQLTRHYHYGGVILLIIAVFIGNYLPILGLGSVPLAFIRNACFFGMPLFMVGYCLRKYQHVFAKVNRWVYLVGAVAFGCLLPFEFHFIMINGGHIEFFPTSILTSVCLLLFITTLPSVSKNCWFYRIFGCNTALWIYLVHGMVGDIICNLCGWQLKYSFLVVFFIALLLALLIGAVGRLIKRFGKSVLTRDTVHG